MTPFAHDSGLHVTAGRITRIEGGVIYLADEDPPVSVRGSWVDEAIGPGDWFVLSDAGQMSLWTSAAFEDAFSPNG